MLSKRLAISFVAAIGLAGAALAAPGGNGNGKGNGGNDGGGDDPSTTVEPAIAYFVRGRDYKDIRLANRAGDEACLVLRNNALRGFAFHGASNQLAYSLDDTGIYIASWTDDPCDIGSATEVRPLVEGNYPEYLDFSPDGQFLAWTEYNAPDIYDIKIWIHDADGGARPLPLSGWTILGIRFSPNFSQSGEIFFVGGDNSSPAGTQWSLFAYNINDPGSYPRTVYDATPLGSSLDGFVGVTNPIGNQSARVAVSIDGEIRQLSLGGQPVQGTLAIPGFEPVYSCDNTEMVHVYRGDRRKRETRITSVDGSTFEQWSRDELRWLDWFCS